MYFFNLFLDIFIYEQQLVVCIPMGFIQVTGLSVQSISLQNDTFSMTLEYLLF